MTSHKVKFEVVGENLNCAGCRYQSLAIGTLAEVVLDYMRDELKLPTADLLTFMPYYLHEVNHRLQDKIQTAELKTALGEPDGVIPPRTKPYSKVQMRAIRKLYPPTDKKVRGSGKGVNMQKPQ